MRVLIAACVLALGAPFTASAAPAYDGSQAATPRQERILELLDRARTVDDIEHRPGYDRSCDPGACVFGEPWTDDHAGPKGHNDATSARRWRGTCPSPRPTRTPYDGSPGPADHRVSDGSVVLPVATRARGRVLLLR